MLMPKEHPKSLLHVVPVLLLGDGDVLVQFCLRQVLIGRPDQHAEIVSFLTAPCEFGGVEVGHRRLVLGSDPHAAATVLLVARRARAAFLPGVAATVAIGRRRGRRQTFILTIIGSGSGRGGRGDGGRGGGGGRGSG